MTDWIWITDSTLDAEVQRAISHARKIFSRLADESYSSDTISPLCKECNTACMRCMSPSRWSLSTTWWKSKKSFADATSSKGCHLCIIIAHAFDKTSITAFGEMRPDSYFRLRFAYRTAERDPSGMLDWEQRTRMPLRDITLTTDDIDEVWLTISSVGDSGISTLSIDLRMESFEASGGRDLLFTKPKLHASTWTEQNMKLASTWLKVCEDSHPMCKAFRPQKPNWRPSRLIYIGSEPQDLRLHVSHDNVGAVSYCALSYCWGSIKSIVLTSEKLAEYQVELPRDILPATIKDAIQTTKELGYKYLWVDALCIIQDSREDWEIQSPQMGNIYGLAALTLAAAGRSNVTDTLYCRRDPRTVRPCVMRARLYDGASAGHTCRWIVYPHEPERLVTAAFNDNPLSKRAWTLQERVLSSRLLVFGLTQMLWSCVTMEACETFPSGLDPQFSTPLGEVRNLANLRQRFMEISRRGELPSKVWNDVVQVYGKARLTVNSDKLVALNGIVTWMIGKIDAGQFLQETQSSFLRGKYVAGLWRDENFQQNLLWRVNRDSYRYRPEVYRAPSWSWASVDGEIIPFEGFGLWTWNKTDIDLANIVDVHVQSSSSQTASLTGQVTGGYIDIICHVRPCHIRRNQSFDDSLTGHTNPSDAIIITSASRRESFVDSLAADDPSLSSSLGTRTYFSKDCTLDYPEDIPLSQWIEAYCVPLQRASVDTDRYERGIWESYEGLVLLSNGEQNSANPIEVKHIEKVVENPTTSSPGSADETGFEDISILPLRTFRRIGIFSYTVNNENREEREDTLLGMMIRDEHGVKSRQKSRIRIL